MSDHVRVWKTPAGVPLCSLETLADPGARNFVLQIKDAWFHGFVVRKGDQVFGYVDRCPHAGLPLAHEAQKVGVKLRHMGEHEAVRGAGINEEP